MADAPKAPLLDEVVQITGLSVDGAGIGRLHDGRVAFVDRALPGDRARIGARREKKNVVQAVLTELVTPAPGRVASRCDIWACGGCPIREAGPKLAAAAKRDHILSAMQRVGGFDMSAHPVPVQSFGDGWQYRHRVRLHAAWVPAKDGVGAGGWSLGYHQRHSRVLSPLSACPVLWPELERLGRALAGGVAQLPQEAQIRTVTLAYSRRDGRGAARIDTDGPMAAMRRSLTWLDGSELGGLHIVAADGQFRWGNLALRYDHAQAQHFDLRFEPGVFTQANTQGNDALVAHVLDQVEPRPQQRVLELHAGIGNFSIPLARRGSRLTAVEIAQRSAILLDRNARNAGVDIDIHAKSDVWALELLRDRPDVLLMDPARGGAREVALAVAALGPAAPGKVVYVSCDAATLARDAAAMVQGGLRLISLVGFDNFAQTPHVECVATFAA